MSSDVSKCDQVVFEIMQKVAEIIVQSRVLQQQQRPVRDNNSKRLFLYVEELEFVRHSMEGWKADLHMPLGIDVFWQEHKQGSVAPIVELLERWEIVYEAQDSVWTKSAHLRHMFKRAIILLRTLYSFVRMVPAYQVHRRIQKAFDSRDRSHEERDDMGFCLYPLLDRGGGGSGLNFPTGATSNERSECQSEQKAPTESYSFKPLEAPHGSVRIQVTYRRGEDPKVRQGGHVLENETSSLSGNMTTSIIQDYVPDTYTSNQVGDNVIDGVATAKGADDDERQMPSHGLANMRGNGLSARFQPVRNAKVENHADGAGALSGIGASLLKQSVNETAAAADFSKLRLMPRTQQSSRKEFDSFEDTAFGLGLHWPSPEQGHGYAHSRLHKLKEKGPAPFLTPGPHRHKLVPGGSQGNVADMEPLDLGPNAGAQLGDHDGPADSLYSSHGDGGRYIFDTSELAHTVSVDGAIAGACTECRPLGMRGGDEADPSVGRLERNGVSKRSVYRRNSISESPMGPAAALPYEKTLSVEHDRSRQSVRTAVRERVISAPGESAPPFSYCEDSSTARYAAEGADASPFDVGQPLVSFSPPFKASPLSNDGHRSNQHPRPAGADTTTASPMLPVQSRIGPEGRCHDGRSSLRALAASTTPALLDTLPESPFSLNIERSSADATTASRYVASFALPLLEEESIFRPGGADENCAADGRTEKEEGLPFAVYSDMDTREDRTDRLEQEPGGFATYCGSVSRGTPPSTLFALCSTTTPKSMILTEDGFHPELGIPVQSFSPDHQCEAQLGDRGAYASVEYNSSSSRIQSAEEAAKTARSLEEELDGFRQFHQELGGMRS